MPIKYWSHFYYGPRSAHNFDKEFLNQNHNPYPSFIFVALYLPSCRLSYYNSSKFSVIERFKNIFFIDSILPLSNLIFEVLTKNT